MDAAVTPVHKSKIKCERRTFLFVCCVTIGTLLMFAYYESITPSTRDKLHFKPQFNITGTDVMVFLHIQKTGGSTFGRHLVHDLNIECMKKNHTRVSNSHSCFRPNTMDPTWLFSRFSSGWKCGLHADWTSLKECVHTKVPSLPQGERKYHYFTILREPVARYLSEWKHVSRGATWKLSYILCNGAKRQLPICYSGWDWTNVTLEEFMDCTENPACNRQTWMLSDLRLVSCDGNGLSRDEMDSIMLQSAKENIMDMPFFGLTERQKDSKFLFEYTFDLKFKVDFIDHNQTYASAVRLDNVTMEGIKNRNKLDIELYKFAVELFDQRLEQAKMNMNQS
uniref:Heparan-sulfate 6-O-sulfotransferase n=1 Tax=Phallusia mammillata TaxID=59560 RepID=A0A6F9DF87_9ASCI|nr:heparan-sulfate 6-O-sulfotransferase 3 [Phallusia mammillata]